MGFAPTGKSIRADAIDIIRVIDGKIVEHWPSKTCGVWCVSSAPC